MTHVRLIRKLLRLPHSLAPESEATTTKPKGARKDWKGSCYERDQAMRDFCRCYCEHHPIIHSAVCSIGCPLRPYIGDTHKVVDKTSILPPADPVMMQPCPESSSGRCTTNPCHHREKHPFDPTICTGKDCGPDCEVIK